jgi:hypothetical protein
MAERLHKRHDEAARKKIQVSQIINRLSDHIDGKVEMSATQIQAAKILLAKSLPDLRMLELSSSDDSPLTIKIIQHASH